jgi:hypothetical protein
MKRFLIVPLAFVASVFLMGAKITDNNLKLGDGSNTDKIIEASKGSTGGNPRLKFNATTSTWQFSNDGTNYADMGSGGYAGINYIPNYNFKFDTQGWSCTGGMTINRTTNSVYVPRNASVGTAAMVAASSASVGNYCKIDFTIDNVDKNKMLTLYWDQINIGAYAAGDFAMVVYDVTNSVEVSGSTFSIPAASQSVSTTFISTSSATYQLRVKTTVATSNGISLTNVAVGPGSLVIGPIPSKQYVAGNTYNGVSLTVTGSGFTLTRGAFVPYKTTDGTWRLRLNIIGGHSAAPSTFTAAISGVTFKTVAGTAGIRAQVCAAYTNGGYNITAGWVESGNGNIGLSANNQAGSTSVAWSCDVELDSQPTWADNNTTAYYGHEQVEYYSYDGSQSRSANGSLVPNTAFGTDIETLNLTITQRPGYTVKLLFNSGGNGWTESSAAYPFVSGHNNNASNICGIRAIWTSSTNLAVGFGKRGTRISASGTDNCNASWATERTNGSRWVVLYGTPAALAGFKVGSPTEVGLVKDWKQYVAGNTYNGVALDVTGVNWTTTRATFVPYQTYDGTYRLKFNMYGTFSVATAASSIGISGISFRSVIYQAVSANHTDSSSVFVTAQTSPSSTVIIIAAGAARSTYAISGDVELNGKPTWMD